MRDRIDTAVARVWARIDTAVWVRERIDNAEASVWEGWALREKGCGRE
jgi:hypothetical protein